MALWLPEGGRKRGRLADPTESGLFNRFTSVVVCGY
jgi:hypothetical protein